MEKLSFRAGERGAGLENHSPRFRYFFVVFCGRNYINSVGLSEFQGRSVDGSKTKARNAQALILAKFSSEVTGAFSASIKRWRGANRLDNSCSSFSLLLLCVVKHAHLFLL